MTEAVLSSNDWDFLRKVYAKTCDENEFKIFRHLAETYSLDPISKEIWCIKTGSQPARIFVSRDGHLAIAHRSGHWGSIETVFDWDDKKQYAEVKDRSGNIIGKVLVPFSATAIIYRNDSSNPTKHTVFWDEYGGSTGLWASKPKTMLQKVAECQGLRRAYNMHGFYSQEEFPVIEESLSPQVLEEKTAENPGEEQEIDWTRTHKTAPDYKDYDQRQMETALKNYTEYDLDKSVFEKAKIGKTGFWDRELINRDYQKQLKEKRLL